MVHKDSEEAGWLHKHFTRLKASVDQTMDHQKSFKTFILRKHRKCNFDYSSGYINVYYAGKKCSRC